MKSLRTAKLLDDEVLALRARRERGETINVKAEADRFGCGLETIRKALRGDTFRHLLSADIEVSQELSEAEVEASLSRFLNEVKTAAHLENPDADIQALLFTTRNPT